MDMSEIETQQPELGPLKPPEPKPGTWHPITWAVIGFALGTVIGANLVLSRDPRECFRGGAIVGGIPGAYMGWAFGAKQLGRRRP